MVLRSLGIGARYVSGYLFAAPPDGGQESVEVQTHAWLEALIPGGGRASGAGSASTRPTAAAPAPRT